MNDKELFDSVIKTVTTVRMLWESSGNAGRVKIEIDYELVKPLLVEQANEIEDMTSHLLALYTIEGLYRDIRDRAREDYLYAIGQVV